jgi:hypothetical protein
MRIVAYTYEAAMHCPCCAYKRFHTAIVKNSDQHGVNLDAVDREGNLVTPVFAIDEGWQGEACDTCFTPFVGL